jgi:peptide/nickel transport system ATP-binding protein
LPRCRNATGDRLPTIDGFLIEAEAAALKAGGEHERRPVLEAKNIVRDYHVGGGLFGKPSTVHAVKGVSFSVEKGKTLAIVGESAAASRRWRASSP